jgi:hypothetical protein
MIDLKDILFESLFDKNIEDKYNDRFDKIRSAKVLYDILDKIYDKLEIEILSYEHGNHKVNVRNVNVDPKYPPQITDYIESLKDAVDVETRVQDIWKTEDFKDNEVYIILVRKQKFNWYNHIKFRYQTSDTVEIIEISQEDKQDDKWYFGYAKFDRKYYESKTWQVFEYKHEWIKYGPCIGLDDELLFEKFREADKE